MIVFILNLRLFLVKILHLGMWSYNNNIGWLKSLDNNYRMSCRFCMYSNQNRLNNQLMYMLNKVHFHCLKNNLLINHKLCMLSDFDTLYN